jgi:hypothetical protein
MSSNYIAAPSGGNRITIFSINNQAKLYDFGVGADVESINNIQMSNDRCSVTYTTNSGIIEYAEFRIGDNQAIKLYNRGEIVGHVQKKKERREERFVEVELISSQGTSMYEDNDNVITLRGLTLVYFSCMLLWYHKLVYNPDRFQGQDWWLSWCLLIGGCILFPILIDTILDQIIDRRRCKWWRLIVYIPVIYVLNYTWINRWVVYMYGLIVK